MVNGDWVEFGFGGDGEGMVAKRGGSEEREGGERGRREKRKEDMCHLIRGALVALVIDL